MTLLPPCSTPLERNLEAVTARTTDIPVPLRDLWNPETCPESLLPWLAWSLGIDAWKPYWPLSIKRALIKDAINVKRKKGTVKSVRDIVAAFGASIVLQENWQTNPPGVPHGFSIVINANSMGGEPVTAEFQQDIIDEITRTKPARSRFTVTAGVSASAQLALAGAARAAIYTRLELTDA
jgi:phage tail P2-like protein